jgi:hypothetical protein
MSALSTGYRQHDLENISLTSEKLSVGYEETQEILEGIDQERQKSEDQAIQYYMSHFSMDKQGNITKIKDVVPPSPIDPKAKVKTNMSSSSSSVITIDQLMHALDQCDNKITSSMQGVIDYNNKNFGLDQANITNSTVPYGKLPLNTSIASLQEHHYCAMPLSYFKGQTNPK